MICTYITLYYNCHHLLITLIDPAMCRTQILIAIEDGPPTPDSSQVNMGTLCQLLVTYSGLLVAVEFGSCHITNQPMTFSPFLRSVFCGF